MINDFKNRVVEEKGMSGSLTETDVPEVKKEAMMNAVNPKDLPDATDQLKTSFSEWVTLLLRLKTSLLEKSHRKKGVNCFWGCL